MSAFLNIKEMSDSEIVEKIADLKSKLGVVSRYSSDEMAPLSIKGLIESLEEEMIFRASDKSKENLEERGTVLETGGYPKIGEQDG